ncbi:MAG: PTS sugar transporter subunit IIA [Treponema sp.]|nr:PTS sugar transporter subunit IIA [Treponema sp.]
MDTKVNLADLIHRGGVMEIDAANTEDAYKKFTAEINLPEGIDSDFLYRALCDREHVLSTAVGHGVALPHTRSPIFKEEIDQRIYVVYLKNPIDMHAPDSAPVNVMFVLLTQNNQTHLGVLSSLAGYLNNHNFKKALEIKANEEKLAAIIRELA